MSSSVNSSPTKKERSSSLEEELVLSCVKGAIGTGEILPYRRVERDLLDWDAILAMASRHRVIPLVAPWMNSAPEDLVPDRVRAEFESLCSIGATRSATLYEALKEVLHHFSNAAVPVVPFQGPELAIRLYGDVTARQFEHLNLLVRRADFDDAKRCLLAAGYRPNKSLTRLQERAEIANRGALEFKLPDSEFTVDLHWRFAERFVSADFDIEPVWRSLERTSLSEEDIATLSAEETLLLLCILGGKHHWPALCWVSDVARLVVRYDDLDWQEICSEAERIGACRFLGVGLLLADRLLAAPIPGSILTVLLRDPQCQELVKRYHENFFIERRSDDWDLLQNDIVFRERFIDRLVYFIRRLTLPFDKDWDVVRLPDFLFPLYYVLKPIRFVLQSARCLGERILHSARSEALSR